MATAIAEPAGAASGDAMYRPGPSVKHYAVFKADRPEGDRIAELRRVVSAASNQTWTVETYRREIRSSGPRAEELIRTDRLVRAGDGVRLVESLNHERRKKSVFLDGGLRMVPALIEPMNTYGNEVTVEIFDLDREGNDTGKLAERGTVERFVEFTGFDVITTPAGEYNAARIETTTVYELGRANVRFVHTEWVEDNLGIVGSSVADTILVLGLPFSQTDELRLLMDAPTP
ncbi:MAG: hypothetical protein AAF747_08590 [Planctomycetota bacterium]